ncbi:MAG: hypothetical protein ACLS8R_10335 [Anaeromassilibacillus sp.]
MRLTRRASPSPRQTIDELALARTKTVTFQVTPPRDVRRSTSRRTTISVCNGHLTDDGDSEDTATLDTETVRVSKAPENTVTKLATIRG